MRPSHFTVLMTAPDAKEAGRIAKTIVKEKLAACVNVIGGIRSLYWWRGKMENSQEALLIAKTGKSKLDKLVRRVKQIHSYSVPEIVALPILRGNPDYLRWLDDSMGIIKRRGQNG